MSPADRETRFLFITFPEWRIAIIAALASTFLVARWYSFISWWIGASVFTFVLVAAHLAYAARLIIPLPHLGIFIALLQYILAPWLNFYFPLGEEQEIGGRLPAYLDYAAPAVVALAVGWLLPLLRMPRLGTTGRSVSKTLLVMSDTLLWGGITFAFLRRIIDMPSIAFALLLLANLRYAGLFARMIAGGSGWSWRALLLLGLEVTVSARGAMFHDLLLWCAWTFVVWTYSRKPKRLTIAAVLLTGVILLPALQVSKIQLRTSDPGDEVITRDTSSDQLTIGRTAEWLSYLGDAVVQTGSFSLEPDSIAEIAARFNQGWIVNRIMTFVPQYEPYAEGETIRAAVVSALIPRVFVAEKLTTGGSEAMQRFSGMQTTENTSMGMGVLGEMYANFGGIGGVIGCFIYGCAFGLLFRFFCVRAMVNPSWWALVPYVFYAAIKMEDNMDFVVNWTAKSLVVIAPLIFFIPELHVGLFRKVRKSSSTQGRLAQ